MPSERIQRRINALLDEADVAFADRSWVRLGELASDVLKLDRESEDARTFLDAAAQGRAEDGDGAPPTEVERRSSSAAAATTTPTVAPHPERFAGDR